MQMAQIDFYFERVRISIDALEVNWDEQARLIKYAPFQNKYVVAYILICIKKFFPRKIKVFSVLSTFARIVKHTIGRLARSFYGYAWPSSIIRW